MPVASRDSMCRCAAAASASGNVRPMWSRSRPSRNAVEAALGALAAPVGEPARHRGQHEAAHLERLRREGRDVERVGRSAGAAVEDEVAEGRQAPEPLLEGRLADRVQDQIDAAAVGEPADLVGEALRRVVDDGVRPVSRRQLALGVARHRREDARARDAGELHRGEAHAPGGGVGEHGLARTDGAGVWSRWYAVSTWMGKAAPATESTSSGRGLIMSTGARQCSA